jgi:hypothetical protein
MMKSAEEADDDVFVVGIVVIFTDELQTGWFPRGMKSIGEGTRRLP